MKLGPYEVLAPIGRGGTGTVHRARGPAGVVAIKVLHRTSPEALARFDRERRLQEALGEHEGFVPLLDSGVAPSGPYLVMPLLDGGTLRDRLSRGALGPGETVALGATLARALARAHALGIVHRDLKPENVLFTIDGRALVADLGLAKHFNAESTGASQSVNLSTSGELGGTAGYMAPEQMRDAKAAGPEADVFALGAILYECLTGVPAFAGSSVLDVVTKVDAGTFDPLPRSVEPWLAAVVHRCLEHDPSRRHADAAALERALLEKKTARRLETPKLLLVLLLVALLTAGALFPLTAATRACAEGARLLARGEYQAALETYSRAIALEPGRAEAWVGCSRAHGWLGERDDELSCAEKAVALAPTLAAALQTRGSARLARRQFAAALADAQRALDLDPNMALALLTRGDVFEAAGDARRAIADYDRAIELDPGRALFWNNRSTARGRRGDCQGAIRDAAHALELDPRLAEAWGNLGAAKYSCGDLDGALADFDRGLAIAPRHPVLLMNRGNAREKKGDADGAIADATLALEVKPLSASLWVNRASARKLKKDDVGAIADASQAIALDPRLASAWGIRGSARANLQDHSRAVADDTRALELDPEATTYLNRAHSLQKVGLVDAAIDDARRALALDSNLPLAWTVLAKCHARQGNTDATRADLDHALAIDPDFATALWLRARFRDQMGDLPGAIADFKKSLEGRPDDASAVAVRKELEALEARAALRK